MSSVREDLGYVPRERKPGKRPPTDGEVVRGWAGFEGCGQVKGGGFDPGPWVVTMRRKNGKRVWLYGQTEADALSRARRWIETEGG